MREKVAIESNSVSCICPMAASGSWRFRLVQRIQAATTCGIAFWSATDSSTLRGSQPSMKFCTLAGDIRSGRPLSWSQPKPMIRSVHRLAACRSDTSSASSEARNSAASSARRSVVHVRLGRGARPGAGGSARIRALMKACRAAKESLTGGSSASSVAASAACSIFLAWEASICLKPSSGRPADACRQCSSRRSTCELTQPSLIMPDAL